MILPRLFTRKQLVARKTFVLSFSLGFLTLFLIHHTRLVPILRLFRFRACGEIILVPIDIILRLLPRLQGERIDLSLMGHPSMNTLSRRRFGSGIGRGRFPRSSRSHTGRTPCGFLLGTFALTLVGVITRISVLNKDGKFPDGIIVVLPDLVPQPLVILFHHPIYHNPGVSFASLLTTTAHYLTHRRAFLSYEGSISQADFHSNPLFVTN